MAADVVVVNHHLFFADMALRDSGVAELLPSVEVAVFDEAHQLAEAGVQFLGTTLGSGQVHRLRARHARRRPAARARTRAVAGPAGRAAIARARDLRIACAGPLRDVRGTLEAALGRARRTRRLRRARWRRWRGAAARRHEALDTVSELGARLRRSSTSARCSWPRSRARFGERGRRRPGALDRRHAAPVRAWSSRRSTSATRCASRSGSAPKAWVFTSATLGDDERLQLVHRVGRPRRRARRCASAARSTTPRMRASTCRAAFRSRTSRAIRPRSRDWRRAARARSAGAPSCSPPPCARCRPSASSCAAPVRRAGRRHRGAAAGPGAQAPADAAVPGAAALGAGRLAELLGRHRRARRRAAVRADRQAAVPAAQRPAGRGARQAARGAKGATRSPTTSSPRRRCR